MSSADEVKIVFLDEFSHHVFTENPAYAPIILSKLTDTSLWVWPKQVTKETLIRYISRSHNILNLFQVLQLRTESSMHTEDFLIDQSHHGKTIEDIAESFPKSDGVSSFAFIIESVDSVDLGTLVITPQEEKVLWVLYFVAEQQCDGLKWLLPSVDIVSQEEVVGLRRESSILKDPKQIIVLPMYVA